MKANKRKKTILLLSVSIIFIAYIFIHGSLISEENLAVNYAAKRQGPSLNHIFGTDDAGRDMYLRTIKGLTTSIKIGVMATIGALFISCILSFLLIVGGRKTDIFVSFLIDCFLSMPHLVFLILISVAVGKGLKGIVIGIALTHWTSLTRLLRTEIKQLKTNKYINISKTLGKSNYWIARKHIFPHLIPQIFVAVVLLFPHAILHESGISFLGFGLPLQSPAIGIILAESMKYISLGSWHLAFFPGLMLVLLVVSFYSIGENLKLIVDPYSYHE